MGFDFLLLTVPVQHCIEIYALFGIPIHLPIQARTIISHYCKSQLETSSHGRRRSTIPDVLSENENPPQRGRQIKNRCIFLQLSVS